MSTSSQRIKALQESIQRSGERLKILHTKAEKASDTSSLEKASLARDFVFEFDRLHKKEQALKKEQEHRETLKKELILLEKAKARKKILMRFE
jgi:hypothetical protein